MHFDYKGVKVTLEQDTDLDDCPLDWGGPYSLLHSHRRGFLGRAMAQEPQALAAELKKRGAEMFPLYLYEHGGQTVSLEPFSCPWDSGQVGFLYVLPEQGREHFGPKWRLRAREGVKLFVKDLDTYLTGDVWYYRFEHAGQSYSLGGIYTQAAALEEAKREVDEALENEAAKAAACQGILAL